MPRAQITPSRPPPEEVDRNQQTKGLLKNGKCILFAKKGRARKDLTLAERTAAYEKKTIEVRTAGYKQYVSSSLKKGIKPPEAIPAIAYIDFPATGNFGFPLGKFPQHKYIHSRLPKDPDRVDYSVDEIDIEYLATMNRARHQKKLVMISIPVFEFWIDRLEKACQFKPKEIFKMRDENGEEIDDVCNVCLDGDTTNCNQIVYCEFCHLAVHQDCYGIPYLPEGALCCRRCGLSPGKLVTCELCPSQAGAFKQMANGKWVHVLCVIWVDETHFGNTIFMEYVQNVEKAIHDRRALSCQLCKNKVDARRGACIQCSETKCTASFHVTCARNAGLVMRISETDDGHVNRFVWCMKHTPEETEEDLEQKERMIRNARRESERPLPTISMPTVTSAAIAAIAAKSPGLSPEDGKEMVLYWYMKRQHRFGAPLLKKFSQPTEVAARRRISQGPSFSLDPMIAEIAKQAKRYKTDLQATKSLADLVVRREQKKRDLVNASLKLFDIGFKPASVMISDFIQKVTVYDKERVFTQPVDLPGYLDEIEHPMCLQTMSNRNKTGHYKSLAEFRVDLDLMLRNCAKFNEFNEFFKSYGKNFGRLCYKILEKEFIEESDRNNLKKDGAFLTQLLNGVTGEYTGWSKKRQDSTVIQGPSPKKISPKKVDIVELVTPETAQPPSKRRRRVFSPTLKTERELKVEEVDMDEPAAQPPPSTPKRSRSRRRGNHDRKDDDDSQKPTTSSYGTRSTSSGNRPSTSAAGEPSTSSVQTPKWSGSNAAQTLRRQVETFGGDVTPKSSKKDAPSSSSSMRQTTLTNFFCAVPKAQQVTFADVAASKSSSHRSLFDQPTSSTKTTRSSSRASASTSAPSVTPAMKSSFRMSSATLQSPLPVLKKVGVKALDTDDDDDEIVVAAPPAPPTMTEAELEAERLRLAENEVNSKYAHNQLVIVDGRAAKVIQEQLAHLGDIHREQRQSMMKKRREVLGEIVEQPAIYVEFFQKSSSLENFKWVTPDAVELLDVNRSPKVVGLRAAKEWYNRVMNGEDV